METGSRSQPTSLSKRLLRWGRLFLWALGGTLLVGLIPALPALWMANVPQKTRWWLISWGPFLLVATVIVLLAAQPRRLIGLKLSDRFWRGIDGAGRWMLGNWLAVAVAVFCVLLFLSWAPHYLTWPWWPDSDQFATSALAWNAGLLPYRDLPDFDFPGPIYVFWALGKLFGWGRTVPFNAFDAAMVAALGPALWAWSKRTLGSRLPGVVSYLAFLIYYFTLDMSQVAQRDWQAPFFAVLGIMGLEAWPGRAARFGSALALAVALTFRPQAVLFLPAVALAIDENARRPGQGWTITVRALFEWGLAFAVGLLLVFGPLLWLGVFDDFLRDLQISTYGGSYNRVTAASFLRALGDQFLNWKIGWTLVPLIVLGLLAPAPLGRHARTWAVAMLCILVYKPMSPIQHEYLGHALILVWTIVLAPLLAWLLHGPAIAPAARAVALLAILAAVVPGIPRYCLPRQSLQALGPLIRGEDPVDAPPGCRRYLVLARSADTPYLWRDYRNLLHYLRTQTDSSLRVANVFRSVPFPSLNGPAGRLSPFPTAGGVLWLWWIRPGDEAWYGESLERTPHSVVVWVPRPSASDMRLRLPDLSQTIRRLYEPDVRFGELEVWRRKPKAVASPVGTSTKASRR